MLWRRQILEDAGGIEALGEEIGDIPAGLYPGDYLKPVGEALAKEHGRSLINMPEDRWLLAAGGPSWGPAILFWGHLVLVLLQMPHIDVFQEMEKRKGSPLNAGELKLLQQLTARGLTQKVSSRSWP